MHALSDPVRVAIFTDIAMSQCSQNCSTFSSVDDKAIPKSTLSQHFKALREAGLIRSQRLGVEMQNLSRCDEINERFPGLLPAIIAAHRIQNETRQRAAKTARKRAARAKRKITTDKSANNGVVRKKEREDGSAAAGLLAAP